MLENCPQLILQVCALTKDQDWLVRTIGTVGSTTCTEISSVTPSDVIRLVSLIFTVVALPLALCADEEAGRYCSRPSYDLVKEVRVFRVIPINLQLMFLYLGFLLTIISRLSLVAMFYIYCLKNKLTLKPSYSENFPNLVTPLCVEAHHMVMFVIYLINQRLAETNKSLIIIEKLRRLNMLVSFFFFSFSEVFLILLQFPQRYRRAIRSRSKERDTGDERYKTFYLLYTFNLLEFIAVIILFSKNNIFDSTQEEAACSTRLAVIRGVFTHDRMMRGAYFSLICYLFSAAFFMFYHSPLLHPDSLKQRANYKTSDFTIYGKAPYCGSTYTKKCKVLDVCSSEASNEDLLDQTGGIQVAESVS